MPQFKECTVDELLRDSLIDFVLKHNNRELFDLLASEQWRDHIAKDENKEKYNDKYNQNEDVLIVFDTLAVLGIKSDEN